jgi:hypothetical protein
VSDIRVGDLVACVTPCLGASEPPSVGVVYRVTKVDFSHGAKWVYIEGFTHGWRATNFEVYNSRQKTDIVAGDIVRCIGKTYASKGGGPVIGEHYRVEKVDDGRYVYPEGLSDGWVYHKFELVDRRFLAGDKVICTDADGSSPPLKLGALYEVFEEEQHLMTLKGFEATARLSYFSKRFKLLPKDAPVEKNVVNSMIDWEASFYKVQAREKKLKDEVDRLRATKFIDPRYVEELENFAAAVHRTVERKPNGESGVEACQRIVDEHKRMKRQLELAESYNFDREGLTQSETIRNLYNYALLGLGKKPLSMVEWSLEVIRRKLANIKPGLWQTPVFSSYYDSDGILRCHIKQAMAVDYIPITFIVTDEKHTHQSDAYSATGCAEGCSHPDCKKGNK